MAWLTGGGRISSAAAETPESLAEKNRLFAARIVGEASGRREEDADETYRTLSQCVERVLNDCGDQMGQLAARLDPNSCGLISPDKFASLADELFEADKGFVIRWERIIVLFAFTFVLSKRLVGRGETSTHTEKLLASYLNEKISSWIQQHGGWVNTGLHFPRKHNFNISPFSGQNS